MRPGCLHAHVDGAEDTDASSFVGGGVGVGGVGGVQVDAQVVAVRREHDGLVLAGKDLAQTINVVDAGHDEFGAEAVELAIVVQASGEPARIDGSQFGRDLGNRLTGECTGHSTEHELQPSRAGIDDTGILEYWILLRRVFDRLIGRLDGALHLGQRFSVGGLDGRRRVGGDGDHRSVAGFGDRIASRLGGAREGL